MGKVKTSEELIKEYNKEYPIIRVASSEFLDTVPKIPSGVFVFDLLTGGGIPLWKYTIFHGLKSSGKSTTALRVVGQFLSAFPDKKVLLMDFEQSFDRVWASYFISDADRLLVVTPPFGEVGVNMIRDFVNTGEFSLIVVDSLAAIIPSKMSESDAEDNYVGEQARLINKMLRIFLKPLNMCRAHNTPLAVLLINQVRVNIGQGVFKSPYVKPCGILQDFLASLDIKFYEGTYHKVDDIPVKVTHQFKIEKNKVCGAIPKRTGEFTMYIANTEDKKIGDLEDDVVVMEYAKRSGILYKEGSKWTFKGVGGSYSNLAEVEQALKNSEIYNQVKTLLLGGVNDI